MAADQLVAERGSQVSACAVAAQGKLRRVRLAEVARAAGVSVSTASRALNGYPEITEATRARIEQAAMKLGYRAHSTARSLRLGDVGMAVAVVDAESLHPGPDRVSYFWSRLLTELTVGLSVDHLALLTVSELESLAEEVGLKKAMGERYAKAKAGKRSEFIQALLAVEGFTYKGAVPKAMRYPRRKFKHAERAEPAGESNAAADAPAQPAVRDARCWTAVVRLVRIQRGIRACR